MLNQKKVNYAKIDEDNGFSYWLFTNELDRQTCESIIQLGNDQWEEAKFINIDGVAEENKNVRVTQTAWTGEQWIYDIIFMYMKKANESAGWNFAIDSAEEMQIGKYPVGGHYHFHMDGNGVRKYSAPNNKFLHDKTRKLSMSIILNDDFEGGEFEFFGDKQLINEKKGSILIFPSYLQHRVRPVTKGTRYSLVAWFLGKPFC